MSTQALDSSSFLRSSFGSSNFDQKVNKGSLIHTAKKAAAVTSVVLGGASLITGFALISVATYGLAIPIVVPFILGGIGATGVTGGCFGLGCIKVNRAAEKVLNAAKLVQNGAVNLEQTYDKQGVITTTLTENLKNLDIQTKQLAKKLGNGDQSLKEVDQKIGQTEKQKKELNENLNKIQSLTISLNKALEKLQNLPTSDREMQLLRQLIVEVHEKLDKLNKNFPRMEQKVGEHNKSLQQLVDVLSSLQKNPALRDLRPSSELEKIATAIQMKNRM